MMLQRIILLIIAAILISGQLTLAIPIDSDHDPTTPPTQIPISAHHPLLSKFPPQLDASALAPSTTRTTTATATTTTTVPDTSLQPNQVQLRIIHDGADQEPAITTIEPQLQLDHHHHGKNIVQLRDIRALFNFKTLGHEEEEGEEEGEREAEEEKPKNMKSVVILLVVIFAILIIVLIIALVTEVHACICAFLVRRRAERAQPQTESERFEAELARTVHWQKLPPGERKDNIL